MKNQHIPNDIVSDFNIDIDDLEALSNFRAHQ